MAAPGGQQRIVIVGGGVGGLEVASTLGRRWRRRPGRPSITLVDRDSAHVWKPMLHTIAAGTRDISQQQTTYLAQARDAGFTYQPGELCGLDRNAREILVAAQHAPDGRLLVPPRRLGDDLLLLAIGSQANDFGTPGVAEYCFYIDSRRQADGFNHEIRIRLLQALGQEAPLSIAIVGGGATGVELAAELVQLVESVSAYGVPDLASRIPSPWSKPGRACWLRSRRTSPARRASASKPSVSASSSGPRCAPPRRRGSCWPTAACCPRRSRSGRRA